MAEAFGIACHELVDFDFRCGSKPEVSDGHANVRCWGQSGPRFRAADAAPSGTTKRGLTVDRIERVTVRVPYREIPRRAMDRELPHWRYTEIFEVHLNSGHVGYGETLLYYTWGVSDDDVPLR